MFYGVIIRLNRPNFTQKREMLKASTIKLGTSGQDSLFLIRSFSAYIVNCFKDH